jgi:hypothetical protein
MNRGLKFLKYCGNNKEDNMKMNNKSIKSQSWRWKYANKDHENNRKGL